MVDGYRDAGPYVELVGLLVVSIDWPRERRISDICVDTFGIEGSGCFIGSAKGFSLDLALPADGLGGRHGRFLCLEVAATMGSANGSSEPKSSPRLPSCGSEDVGPVREARRRSARRCNSRSSMPKSCEKSGGPPILASFSFIPRAAA